MSFRKDTYEFKSVFEIEIGPLEVRLFSFFFFINLNTLKNNHFQSFKHNLYHNNLLCHYYYFVACVIFTV